jgi:hypothetical protein
LPQRGGGKRFLIVTFSLATSCCRPYFHSRTSFEVDLALDGNCSSHHPTEWRERSPVSGRQVIASRTHRKKNVFKSACRVEMLLAAVQVWTREWDDDPLLLNCSVASGSQVAILGWQAPASGQREEPAGDLSSYLFAIFSDTTPITRKKKKRTIRRAGSAGQCVRAGRRLRPMVNLTAAVSESDRPAPAQYYKLLVPSRTTLIIRGTSRARRDSTRQAETGEHGTTPSASPRFELSSRIPEALTTTNQPPLLPSSSPESAASEK